MTLRSNKDRSCPYDKYLLTITFLTLSFASSALAQQADRWKDLVLDESTPELAINTLGKPKSDKPKFDKYVKYLVKNEPKVNVRSIHWEKTGGFKDVRLIFHNGKLIVISLQFPQTELSVGDLAKAYGDLSFSISKDSVLGMTSANTFNLIAYTDRSLVRCIAYGGPGFTGKIKEDNQLHTQYHLFGRVEYVTLVSRSFGPAPSNAADLLK